MSGKRPAATESRLQTAAWQPLGIARPPAALRPWLAMRGSLTHALERTGEPVRVGVLEDGWQRPWPDERQRLGLGAGCAVWAREVCLRSAGLSVFARTLITPKARLGALRPLADLGRRPLGHWLFQGGGEDGVARHGLEVARLGGRGAGLLLRLDAHGLGGTGCWARRSVLWAHGQPLLVTEVFVAGWGGPSGGAW